MKCEEVQWCGLFVCLRRFDDDPARHLRVDVAEVVDDAAVRPVRDGLRDRELGRVLVRHPGLARVEELPVRK